MTSYPCPPAWSQQARARRHLEWPKTLLSELTDRKKNCKLPTCSAYGWMKKCSTTACFKCEMATHRNAMTTCFESTSLGNSQWSGFSGMTSCHLLSNYNSMGQTAWHSNSSDGNCRHSLFTCHYCNKWRDQSQNWTTQYGWHTQWLRWLGHVIQMDHQRIPRQALHWEVPGFKRGPGRLWTNRRSTVNKDLLRMGITWEEALSRSEWRRSVAQSIHLDSGWIKVKDCNRQFVKFHILHCCKHRI